jgi:YD repeat-containing protein
MRSGLRFTVAILGLLLSAGAWRLAAETVPTTQSIAARRVFPNPLIPVKGTPSEGENKDLDQALATYLDRGDSEALSPLLAFLDRHPDSPWRASLLANFGDVYERQGLATRALGAWREAWDLARGPVSPAETALAEGSVTRLLRLYGRLGRSKELATLLEELQSYPVRGVEGVWVADAGRMLNLMQTDPQAVFRCGPLAFGQLAQAIGKGDQVEGQLESLHVGPKGTTLAQIQAWGLENEIALRGIQREAGSPIPVPSIIHLKIGHFATIVGQEGSRFWVKNYLGGGDRLIAQNVIDEETSGLALVPEGVKPLACWKVAEPRRLATAWGTGYTGGPDSRNPWHDVGTNVPSSCGMPRYQFIPAQASLDIEDTPLWYTPPVGPAVKFHLTYNNTDNNLPNSFTFWNVGPKWNSDWLSYVVDDPANPGVNTSLYQRGGGVLIYSGYNSTNGAFAPQYYGNDILIRTSNTSYERDLPDGSKEIFTVASGTLAPRMVFLTQVVDPSGNALTFTYDASFRLVAARDALGQISTLSYSGADPLQVTQVKDPFGRTASFRYGAAVSFSSPGITSTANEFLASITDMGGLTSTFQYLSAVSSWLIPQASGTELPGVKIAKVNEVKLNNSSSLGKDLGSNPGTITNCENPALSGSSPMAKAHTKGLTKAVASASLNNISTDDNWATYYFTGTGGAFYPQFFPFVTGMTTPYGTTSFGGGLAGVDLMVQATDPLGQSERVEFHNYTGEMAESEAVAPPGIWNNYFSFRNTFYWDKRAMAQAPGDWTQATVYHFFHSLNNIGYMSPILEGMKKPLESRVFFKSINSYYEGQNYQPSAVARVLDDGTTQETQKTYNFIGNVTSSIDAAGRTTSFTYAANGVDLLQVANTTGGINQIQASYTYNSQHKPLTITDASGQTTTLTYNASGQVLTVTDPLQETTTFSYTPPQGGYLTQIAGPLTGSTTSFTYDAVGRVATVTDPEGRTIGMTYDNLDRTTVINYPDGTNDYRFYTNLDLTGVVDRKGQMTSMQYNPLRQLTQVQDALGRLTQLGWCSCGSLEQLIDPLGQITNWWRDLQGRVVGKALPDGTQTSYGYDSAGRLTQRIDAKGQLTQYQYWTDDKLAQVSYPGAQHPTPTVAYGYDSAYPRLASMSDGFGQTTYRYNPVMTSPGLGAGRLASVIGPFPNSEIDYSYDGLGRVNSRSINGVGEVRSFDALGRTASVTNPLGAFLYGYVGGTNRLSSINLPNGQSTSFNYYGATNDFRLQSMANQRNDQSVISSFAYTYDPNGMITSWSRQADANLPTVYSYQYDAANQLLGAVLRDSGGNVLHQYGYGYDLAGNRASEQIDGQITSSNFNNVNQLINQVMEQAPVQTEAPQALKRQTGRPALKPAAVSP